MLPTNNNTIPYYALRSTIWPKSQRQKTLYTSIALGIVLTLIITTIIGLNQLAPWIIAFLFGAGVGIIVMFVYLFLHLFNRALDPSDEQELVKKCADEIGQKYNNPINIASIRESITPSSSIFSTKTILPICLLPALIPFIASDSISLEFRVLILEIASTLLVPFLATIIDGHADAIIQRALAEHTRRLALTEQTEAITPITMKQDPVLLNQEQALPNNQQQPSEQKHKPTTQSPQQASTHTEDPA